MTKQTQQEYLNVAKIEYVELGGKNGTWDLFAETCGISPRAFKTYRMPEDSKDYRVMPSLARDAVERVLKDQRIKAKRNTK
jgi:hypothetical protein